MITLTIIGYVLAYNVYGKYLARKVFKLSAKYLMPSKKYKDGVDYIPTKPHIVFGHHFTTIAGVGPIVGPAIGIIWGWVPAFLWIFFGSIFMGAVHDFTTMVISGRNNGKSITDLTNGIIGKSAMFSFQLILQLLLVLVLSIFTLIVSTLFIMYPETVIPVWFQIPVSLWLGRRIRKNKRNPFPVIIALIMLYALILVGMKYPVNLETILFSSSLLEPQLITNYVTIAWCILLFIYVYIASTLPVDKLLQPRDYVNSWQLILILVILTFAIIVAHPAISAPMINAKAFLPGSDVPPLAPLLFIVIACGAISGFHSIASSGTTIKQISNEKHSLSIGFGSMLTEGFLAILVLICVGAGLGYGVLKDGELITGSDSFYHFYSSWATRNSGIGAKLESFIQGAANLMAQINIPKEYAAPLIAVFIVSFANTTLDSAARMQRITFQELTSKNSKLSWFKNRFFTSAVLILIAGVITFLKPGGTGALRLWPMFGTLNQLLAAMGLLVVTVYLYKKKKAYIVSIIPTIIILFLTVWAMINNLLRFIKQQDILLIGFSAAILILTSILLANAIATLTKSVGKNPRIK
ncbi:MAG: hypothetical protein MI922_07415 [Bacteroidales bacterium]|nr:hypothetical protein [Bacteroidales bacterium]